MNKDYLTSPFNDNSFNNVLDLAKKNHENIISMLNPTFKLIDSLPITKIYESIIPNIPTTLYAEQFEKTKALSSEFINFYKGSYIVQAQEIAKSYSDLIKATSAPLDLSNILTSFDSFIKDEAKRPNQEPKKSCSQINTKSEVNIITESDKVNNLKYAFINFQFHAEIFKEFFHKPYSYISERKIVVFGVANAFVYLVTLAAQIHPLLPFWLFSITSIVGLFMPSDK